MRTFLFTGLFGLLLVNLAFSLDKQRDCKCRLQTKRRIIGGREAAPMAYPHLISLQRKEFDPVPDKLRKLVPESEKIMLHNCGGSIINKRWIITASHCLGKFSDVFDPREWQVAFGDNDLVQMYDRSQYKQIEAFYRHPGFDGRFGTKNDVGLIKLNEPLVFNETVQPACLDFEEQQLYDGALKISGWGSVVPIIREYGRGMSEPVFSRRLKETEVFDHSQAGDCDHKQNICLNDEKTSSCLGDSGGPIHNTKNGKSSVVGVLSFVNSKQEGLKVTICAGKMSYTRLSSFKSWVEEKIGQDYCS